MNSAVLVFVKIKYVQLLQATEIRNKQINTKYKSDTHLSTSQELNFILMLTV